MDQEAVMKIARAAALASMVLLLPGCARVLTGSLCTAGPIILDSQDDITRSTTEQIVTLNESGAKVCGWRPPAR
jgi:hypothetical protein